MQKEEEKMGDIRRWIEVLSDMEEDQNEVKENDWSEHVTSCWQRTQQIEYSLSASVMGSM